MIGSLTKALSFLGRGGCYLIQLLKNRNKNNGPADYLSVSSGSMKNYNYRSLPSDKHSHPTTLYHGTTFENAIETCMYGFWSVEQGHNKILMTEDFSTACVDSGKGGAVVELAVSTTASLKNHANGVYTYDITNVKPRERYYAIPGITPVAVYDPDGNKLP